MDGVAAYCLYTRAGREKKAARYISYYTGLDALYPYRVLKEKRQGKWRMVERPMIPGYVFFFGLLLPEYVMPIRDMGRIICDVDGQYELTGNDLAYAFWVQSHRGVFGVSNVMKEGDRIRVVDGPLKDFFGEIRSFDRHKRRVTLSVLFDGREHNIQMSVDEIAPQENPSTGLPNDKLIMPPQQ